MKPAFFDYVRASSVPAALDLLTRSPSAKVIAGGQTLGPMLNLRLVQPDMLIDIRNIPELTRVADTGDSIRIGACTTHAAIEDGNIPDPAHGFLRRVARDIAYRAVRSRGTIGGSLVHADPAADWISCLTALGAEVIIASPRGERRTPLAAFVRGALDCDLGADEILAAVGVAKLTPRARTGYHKICRKTGEFADAIGVFVHDPGRIARFVAGATGSRPVVIEAAEILGGTAVGGVSAFNTEAAVASLVRGGLEADAYQLRLHAVALRRAFAEAQA